MRLGGSRSALFLDTARSSSASTRYLVGQIPVISLLAAGFFLFGRQKQTKFARTACERMAQLTRAQLAEKKGFGAI